jgi:hypothetical protein
MILTDYSEKLERVLEDMREVVDHVTSLRRQPERQDLPESKGVQGPKDTRKSKSPGKKDRDVIMSSATKEVESGSEGERFPIPDLHQRRGLKAFSPD